jgi:hypothetical protein
MRAPCKDCPDRHELCHAHCEKYIEYRKQLDEVREKRMMEAEINSTHYAMRKKMAWANWVKAKNGK